MDAEPFIGRWTVIIQDPEEPGHKMPAWKAALPLGAVFYISRNAVTEYWYLPMPGARAPMDKARLMSTSPEQHEKFEVGAVVPGSLFADLGADGGKLYFTVNLVDGRNRIMSLSQSHGGVHAIGE
jgi:hypothetical protein